MDRIKIQGTDREAVQEAPGVQDLDGRVDRALCAVWRLRGRAGQAEAEGEERARGGAFASNLSADLLTFVAELICSRNRSCRETDTSPKACGTRRARCRLPCLSSLSTERSPAYCKSPSL